MINLPKIVCHKYNTVIFTTVTCRKTVLEMLLFILQVYIADRHVVNLSKLHGI